MKKLLMSAVLLATLIVSIPGRAECPFDKDNKQAPAMKHPVSIRVHKVIAPEPEESWHDLHWLD